MLGYLSVDIICSEKRTVFWARSSRKTVSFKEQITMSKAKYSSIFLPQMEAIVFIIPQIFFATHTVLKIGEYSLIFPSISWGIFSHMMCSDQSHMSENIWLILIRSILVILQPRPLKLGTCWFIVLWEKHLSLWKILFPWQLTLFQTLTAWFP